MVLFLLHDLLTFVYMILSNGNKSLVLFFTINLAFFQEFTRPELSHVSLLPYLAAAPATLVRPAIREHTLHISSTLHTVWCLTAMKLMQKIYE